LFASLKNTINCLIFGFLFFYILVGSLDFSGNLCFSNKHHKLSVSVSKDESGSSALTDLTTFFIEEEDIKENELKKNCTSFSFLATQLFSSLSFENVNLTQQIDVTNFRFFIPTKELLQLNCILRI